MTWLQLVLLIPWVVVLLILVIGGVVWSVERSKPCCHRCRRPIRSCDGILCEDCTGHLERRRRSHRRTPPVPHHFPVQD
jgi:predicted amidophosphoribosyltransferase